MAKGKFSPKRDRDFGGAKDVVMPTGRYPKGTHKGNTRRWKRTPGGMALPENDVQGKKDIARLTELAERRTRTYPKECDFPTKISFIWAKRKDGSRYCRPIVDETCGANAPISVTRDGSIRHRCTEHASHR